MSTTTRSLSFIAIASAVGGWLLSIHILGQANSHEPGGVSADDDSSDTRSHKHKSETNCPNASLLPGGLTTAATSGTRSLMPFAVVGVATTPKNTGHRTWIRETWMSLPNVQTYHPQRRTGNIFACFLIGVLTSSAVAHPPQVREQLRHEQRTHGDLLLLNARETKPPGEKMIGFFRWCATNFGYGDVGKAGGSSIFVRTRYCVKTDDDAYVQTVRLEVNLRALWSRATPTPPTATALPRHGPLQYAGATLWASYIEKTFEVCGHGMGPNMAASAAKRERCAERTGVGPFPYVAGTLEVLSMPLAEYIIEQSYVGMFVQRAHSRIPVAWSLGEDTVLGMWVHMTPFAITALHWGWDKIHDLCFLCKDKTQLWKPITTQTVVVHIKGHQASWYNFGNVHNNISERCDADCMQVVLPFDVPNLADLCGRNENIRRGYSKCALL